MQNVSESNEQISGKQDKLQTSFLASYFAYFSSNFSLMLLLHTILFYFIANISAYLYYSNWGVPYFQFTSLSTVLAFSIQNTFSIIFLTLFVPFSIGSVAVSIFEWRKAKDTSRNLFHLFVTRANVLTMAPLYLLAVYSTIDFFLLGSNDVKDFKKGKLDFYIVKSNFIEISCGKPIGDLGDFVVIKDKDFNTYYINKSEVSLLQITDANSKQCVSD